MDKTEIPDFLPENLPETGHHEKGDDEQKHATLECFGPQGRVDVHSMEGQFALAQLICQQTSAALHLLGVVDIEEVLRERTERMAMGERKSEATEILNVMHSKITEATREAHKAFLGMTSDCVASSHAMKVAFDALKRQIDLEEGRRLADAMTVLLHETAPDSKAKQAFDRELQTILSAAQHNQDDDGFRPKEALEAMRKAMGGKD